MNSHERVERKLTTILSADVQGFSRLMGADEDGTMYTLPASRGVREELLCFYVRVFGTSFVFGVFLVMKFRFM
jgi:class 3 adenylate cyclase